MQVIETKYHGATNTKGSRISATASGCKARVVLSYDYNKSGDDNHKAAALALMNELDWRGVYVGGHTKMGMMFVSNDPMFSYTVER